MTFALFQGYPGHTGAPNIDALYGACPREFKRLDSPWRPPAARLCAKADVGEEEWKFRSNNEGERVRQKAWITWVIGKSSEVQDRQRHECIVA